MSAYTGNGLYDDILGQILYVTYNICLQLGTKFNIKSLFGEEWNMGINKGIKLNLGKPFFGCVNSQVVKNVECIGKDSSNIMWYKGI